MIFLSIHIQLGRAAEQFELQVPSSTETPSDAGLPEHEVEESNAVSVEQVTEVSCLCYSYYQLLFNKLPCTWVLIVLLLPQEKPAVKDEGKEVPLLVNSREQLHDAASAEDSSRLKQCTASTEQSLHAGSNTGLSSASTEDINATAVAASLEIGVVTEKVSSLVHFDDELYND